MDTLNTLSEDSGGEFQRCFSEFPLPFTDEHAPAMGHHTEGELQRVERYRSRVQSHPGRGFQANQASAHREHNEYHNVRSRRFSESPPTINGTLTNLSTWHSEFQQENRISEQTLSLAAAALRFHINFFICCFCSLICFCTKNVTRLLMIT